MSKHFPKSNSLALHFGENLNKIRPKIAMVQMFMFTSDANLNEELLKAMLQADNLLFIM